MEAWKLPENFRKQRISCFAWPCTRKQKQKAPISNTRERERRRRRRRRRSGSETEGERGRDREAIKLRKKREIEKNRQTQERCIHVHVWLKERATEIREPKVTKSERGRQKHKRDTERERGEKKTGVVR